MSRTIESIVDNHRQANERRKAGKPVWDRTINIKQILREDPANTSPTHACNVANQIGLLVKGRVPADWLNPDAESAHVDLIDLINSLTSLSVDDNEPLAELNSLLDQLYDWADSNRVWLG